MSDSILGDKRPQHGFWAPGAYSCKCCQCNKGFIGDKRAINCADCAYKDEAMTTPIPAEDLPRALAEAMGWTLVIPQNFHQNPFYQKDGMEMCQESYFYPHLSRDHANIAAMRCVELDLGPELADHAKTLWFKQNGRVCEYELLVFPPELLSRAALAALTGK